MSSAASLRAQTRKFFSTCNEMNKWKIILLVWNSLVGLDWIWIRSRIIDEFDFCKVNEFGCSFFKVDEFEFKNQKQNEWVQPYSLAYNVAFFILCYLSRKKIS